MRIGIICLGLALLFVHQDIYSQTTLNPDISAIGDFRIFSHGDAARSNEKEKLNLADPEVELNINGYLNPYVRADIVMGWHGDHNAEIEEAYATFLRGLPFRTNLRVGKYLLEFGRLNPIHPHAYSFIDRPLPHEYFFGEEGLSDMTIRASIALPTGGAFTELMCGLLKGDALTPREHEHMEDDSTAAVEQDSEDKRDLGFFGRLTTSLSLSESAELAIGGSVLNAVSGFAGNDEHDVDEIGDPEQLRSWIIGGDIKYKSKPSRYRSLQVEAEGIMRISQSGANEDDLYSYGSYGYIDYRFRQKYNIGGILEWVRLDEIQNLEDQQEPIAHRNNTCRAGLFVGFAPIEETSLIRIAGHWIDTNESDGYWEAKMQLVISLGPHRPHNF
ncbi:MAG: hypothetical protein CVT49_12300 [candidate division Zixibacteria bacterium HGW-Zixibacteria-1]|nr:MAG: hypothetical protein CVT49_12300 [candidate division Zixibacteria bacterium HGW-Zixibacteria-1]